MKLSRKYTIIIYILLFHRIKEKGDQFGIGVVQVIPSLKHIVNLMLHNMDEKKVSLKNFFKHFNAVPVSFLGISEPENT